MNKPKRASRNHAIRWSRSAVVSAETNCGPASKTAADKRVKVEKQFESRLEVFMASEGRTFVRWIFHNRPPRPAQARTPNGRIHFNHRWTPMNSDNETE